MITKYITVARALWLIYCSLLKCFYQEREMNELFSLAFITIQERISEEEQSQSALAKIQMLKTSIFKYECYI